ncbi:putative RDD family membrane protein YckC [Nocardiopsis arvandica]|uniref:Putative RDD family membrane protein YckC n=1 Tax=Nocardiopsis sinuspersici TaxID=501010 RepID=A0A7Z0BIP8_9ACTN|nr:RDD family protein [Nocardiopsis sinuspersici]NYH52938.1 putative RDD family membrane protein YckC [Nocardiopsis sinuspersici]
MQPPYPPSDQGDHRPSPAAWPPGTQPPPAPPYPTPGHSAPAYQQGYHPPPRNWLPPVITDPGQWSPAQPQVGLADPGTRFVARAIDTAALVLLWFLMMLLGTFVSVALGGGEIEGGASNVFMVFAVFNFFLMPIVVEWLQVRVWGRSIGKMLLGLWVVRSDGGGGVTAGRALVRALLYAPGHTNLVNWLLPWSLTNVLWSLRDKTLRQCLHDKAAGTVVVQARR